MFSPNKKLHYIIQPMEFFFSSCLFSILPMDSSFLQSTRSRWKSSSLQPGTLYDIRANESYIGMVEQETGTIVLDFWMPVACYGSP